MNVRGILPTVQQVLPLLSYPGRGYPIPAWGYPILHIWLGRYPIPGQWYPLSGTWIQKAYCPQCSKYTSAVLSRQGVPHPCLGVPYHSYLAGKVSHPWPGVPLSGTGYPLSGTGVPLLGLGYPCLGLRCPPIWDYGTLRNDMGPVEVLWDGDGVPPQGVDRHTSVKTVPPSRTTYAGGNSGKEVECYPIIV